MRIVFMGTPDFAVPSLKALVEAGHEVCGVFTQPDKPKNRGMKLQQSPVKQAALTLGLSVYQPARMRDGEALAILQELRPDLIAVAAYGKILPVDILDLPRLGCVNVHSSLLPRYRGAAPINWAILNGEDETGVTIMCMAEGMDTGDILAQAKTPIDINENAAQLFDRLAELGAGLLMETVKELETGTASPVPQDETLSSHAPMLCREQSPWTGPGPPGSSMTRYGGCSPGPPPPRCWTACVARCCARRCPARPRVKRPAPFCRRTRRACALPAGTVGRWTFWSSSPTGKRPWPRLPSCWATPSLWGRY